MSIINKRSDKGFTLIEMVVSIGIFAVAALIGTTALLSLAVSQRKAIAIQSAYDNLRFAVEVIAKDLRTGDIYHCGSSVPVDMPLDCDAVNTSGASTIVFQNALGQSIKYSRNVGLCGGTTASIVKSVDGGADDQVTGCDIDVQALTFYVKGSPVENPPFQPVVTIVAKGLAGQGKWSSQFSLQTTVTQRTVRQ